MTDSMWASSAALMPMWRAMNSLGFQVRPGAGRQSGGIDMVRVFLKGVKRVEWGANARHKAQAERWGVTGRWQRTRVGGLVHQRGEFSRVGQLDLEEPAGAQRVGVGQRGSARRASLTSVIRR
jgi:hypothetical protein